MTLTLNKSVALDGMMSEIDEVVREANDEKDALNREIDVLSNIDFYELVKSKKNIEWTTTTSPDGQYVDSSTWFKLPHEYWWENAIFGITTTIKIANGSIPTVYLLMWKHSNWVLDESSLSSTPWSDVLQYVQNNLSQYWVSGIIREPWGRDVWPVHEFAL